MTRLRVVPGLEATGYARHMLHAEDRVWVEKNCYVDVCIELLHALGAEPLAMLGSCAAVDFEGDNFTFYKPSHDEMRALFGLDVQELNVWLPLVEHAAHHLGEGRLISTEADAFHLPDVSATDYRRNHVKTTIILADLDVDGRRLGYFHNAGYFELGGEDFDHLFRMAVPPDPAFLPLFAELVRVDRLVCRPAGDLAKMARALLAIHVRRRPEENPITKFQQRFERDLPSIQDKGLGFYHAWAFATVRQMGAAYELLGQHLRWLEEAGRDGELLGAADEFDRVSVAAKAFILKAARAVNSRKPFDAAAIFTELAGAWDRGMQQLARSVA